MSANLKTFAATGSRDDVWHRWGNYVAEFKSDEDARKAANMDYTAVKIPAYVPVFDVGSVAGDVGELLKTRYEKVENAHFIARNDTGALLSDRSVSDVYRPHQIADLQHSFGQYCDLNDNFKRSTIGSLGNGERVFMTAEYTSPVTVAGDTFKAYLLATTSFDGTGATKFVMSLIRAVCANTVAAALASAKGRIAVRHNTKFDPVEAGRQLAAIIQSVEKFKVMGDAMAQVHMAQDAVVTYFKSVLEIPFDVEKKDISARKLNQYETLFRDYRTTLTETDATAWAAFNAVTRYVDHDRSVRGGDNVELARFASAQFGSGNALKEKAWNLLTPLIKDKVAA